MPIIVVCSSCSKKYRLKDELEGKKFRCKGCEQVLTVTASSALQTVEKQERRRSSKQKQTSAGDDQSARRRRRRKQAKQADAYGDDLFGAALDRYGGKYGEDIPDEDNPYRAPAYQGDSKKRKRSGKTAKMSLSEKLFSFEGRINRTNYWVISIVNVFVYLIVLAFLIPLGDSTIVSVLTFVCASLFGGISLSLQVKRWHDRDKSGWWCLIGLIPLIGGLWTLIELGFLAGTPGMNSYGRPPA